MKVIRNYRQAVKALERGIPYDPAGADGKIEADVRRIIASVRQDGDKALFAYTERFDERKRQIIETWFRKDLDYLGYRFGEPPPMDYIEPKLERFRPTGLLPSGGSITTVA